MSRHYNKNLNAYITLISVIIVGAIILAFTIFLLANSIDSTRNSLAVTQSAQAKFLVEACAEDALQRIRDNTSFSGTTNISFPSGLCSSTVFNTGGNNRTINATSSVANNTKKVRILINALNPKIIISSWLEVDD